MKKRVLCAVVLGLLLVSGAASGKVREFEYFTLDIPKGWKVATKDASVRVRKEDKSASIIITIDSIEGRSAEEIAAKESKKLKGTQPEQDEDGDYSFTANDGKTQVMVSEAGGYFIMLNMTCTDDKSADELGAIMDSFEMKDMSGAGGDEDSGEDD